jgi:ADP-heptose:LPS heptosyltransferase
MMKVVIIKFGALGDVIISTPVIKKLVAEHSGDDLTLLTSPAYAGLFQGWPGLKVKQFPRRGLGANIKSVQWIRNQNFDRVYDLQSNDRSRLLCCFSGIKEKVGTHNYFPYTHHPGDRYTGQTHIFERHNLMLKSVNIEPAQARPWLPVPEQAQQHVEHWLNTHKLKKEKLVLLHAGANPRHPQKRWPYFLALAKKVVAAGYKVIWLGAADDAELNKRLAHEAGVDASNVFSITELIALGEKSAFALTNDSGPMHVLACADLPVYALFGPTNWRRNHALGQQEHVLSLDKTNSVWNADNYSETEVRDLGLISAKMVYSVLLEDNQIIQ